MGKKYQVISGGSELRKFQIPHFEAKSSINYAQTTSAVNFIIYCQKSWKLIGNEEGQWQYTSTCFIYQDWMFALNIPHITGAKFNH